MDINTRLTDLNWMPYKVPIETRARAKILGEILGLKPSYAAFATPEDNELMAAVILYPHVDSADKSEILHRLHNHKNRSLAGKLRSEVAAVMLVNRSWGMWSLSTEELNDKLKSHKFLKGIFSAVGAKGIKDLLKSAKKPGPGFLKHPLVLSVIALTVAANEKMLKDTKAEIGRRTTSTKKDYAL